MTTVWRARGNLSAMKTDPRVDTYIAQAPAFAQPLLQEVRARVGKACPSAEETIKWNVPFFLLGEKILASMAAFKKHVKVGVWTGMMPKFVDVSEIEELPSSKDFAQQLKAAAQAIDLAMTSADAKQPESKKAGGSKTREKAPAAKKTAVKAPAQSSKKPPEKKTLTKKSARKSK